jgi:hypothetical protein
MPDVNDHARRAATLAAALLLTGVLAWPLLFTNATFNEDWLNHLWYLWHQSRAIRADHAPSLFLEYSGGVFYPIYAFYGGTLYALAGTLSLVLGDAPLQSYVLTYLLGLLAAYGGWYWMSRMFGLARWEVHMPGLVFVTSASYLMLIYGLGDWPEFLAVSAMPPLIAAGLSVLRAERLQTWPALALAVSAVVFFGSHLLTVIWGSTILLLVGLALLLCVPEARHGVTRAGVVRVAGLLLPALLVSAWFLLPTIAYESQTVIAASYPRFRGLLRASMYTVSAKNLFTFSRARSSGTVVTLALPILAIAWVLVSLAASLRAGQRGKTWSRVLLILCAVSALVGIAMTHAGLILALPRLYATLQFSFRLESFLLLGVSGAVLAALVAARDGPRGVRLWNWALVPIAIVSLYGAIEQVDAYPHGRPRGTALSSYLVPTFEREGLLDYVNDRQPIVARHLPRVDFPPDSLHGDRATQIVRARPGQLVDTNIRSTPDLVRVTGARIVGADPEADDVLEVSGAESTPTHTISVAAAGTLPVTLGRVLSVLALVVLAGQLLWPTVRRVRGSTSA